MASAKPETIEDLMYAWLEIKRCVLKQVSYAAYLHAVKMSIVPLAGSVRLDEITREHLQGFVDQLCARGISEKSVWDINSKLNAALRWAAERRYIEHAGFCVRTRFRQSDTPQVLPEPDKTVLQMYLRHTDGERHVKAGVLLCLECGLKIGELCALRFEDVDLNRRSLVVNKRIQRIVNMGGAGKKTLVRTFPVEPRQVALPHDMAMLIRQLRRTDQTAFFLTGKADKYMEPRLLQNHLKGYLKECGLDASIVFNTLRATYISSALESGEDILHVGKMVGAKRLAHIGEKYRAYYYDHA